MLNAPTESQGGVPDDRVAGNDGLFVGAVSAERLPIRTFTSADGLPSGTVDIIVRDSADSFGFAHTTG